MIARRPQVPLYGVAICALLFTILLVLAYASPAARHFDASALQGFGAVGDSHESAVDRIAVLGDAAPVALIALALSGFALLRGRPRIALAVLFLVAATSVSSQLLKELLAWYPRWSGNGFVGPDAFPSGHSTAAMTLALCGVLVAPGRLRPLAGLVGLSFALAVGFSVVSLRWHFPSDVIGGFLLATAWTLVVVSGLLWLEERRPERTGRLASAGRAVVDRVAAVGLVTAVLVGAVLVALAVVGVLASRGGELASFFDSHTAAAVVAPAIVVAGAALLAAVTLFLRRSD